MKYLNCIRMLTGRNVSVNYRIYLTFLHEPVKRSRPTDELLKYVQKSMNMLETPILGVYDPPIKNGTFAQL
jgi:hypothetical protein